VYFLEPLKKKYTSDIIAENKKDFIIQLPEIEEIQGIFSEIIIQSDLGSTTWTNEKGTVSSEGSQMTYNNFTR